jgi:transposase
MPRSATDCRGTTPVIPNKINRRKPYPHNKRAYRHRNKIERLFCRLKDERRIATRDEKCANNYNFLSAVCLVALLSFWSNSVWNLDIFLDVETA